MTMVDPWFEQQQQLYGPPNNNIRQQILSLHSVLFLHILVQKKSGYNKTKIKINDGWPLPGWFEQQLYGPPNNNAMENAISTIIMDATI